jgi:PucR family transcriptional regulator, purine catabolism regulatory protein
LISFTVRELISKETLQGLKMVAGDAKIDNVIFNVNTMDNPDAFDWFTTGDFVLTTGFIFKDDPELQVKIIRELADINCSGIGIKPKRFLGKIPTCMIEEANRVNLPIIEIPFQYSLSLVSSLINNEIHKREDSALKKLFNIHEALTKCSLEGGGLDELVKVIAKLVGNPVLIVDSKWRLLTFAEHHDNMVKISDYLDLNRKEKIFPAEFIEDMPQNIQEFKKSVKRRYPNNKGEVVCRVLPFHADKTSYGYLVVWETVNKMSSVEYMALEASATNVALERLKTRQIEEARHLLQQDFFDDLLEGKIESVHAANYLAEFHNLDPRKKYICMISKIENEFESMNLDLLMARTKFNKYKEELISVIDHVAYLNNQNVLSIHRGNFIISFIKVKENTPFYNSSLYLKEFVDDVYDAMMKYNEKTKVRIGIGKPCPEFLEMKKSYTQAQEAIRISVQINQPASVSFYEELLIYHLLDSVNSRDSLEELYQSTLGRLLSFDQQNNANLVDTLAQYFQSGGNISDAAKRMFLHRNTFIYRLEKIKTILNSELKNPDEVFKIQIGLLIMKIINNPKVKEKPYY